jgi:hypothetical protein
MIIRKVAITVAAAAGVLTIGATAASASTPTCTNAASGTCGAEVNAFGNAFAVTAAPAQNVRVRATPADTTASQDFIAVEAGSNANARTFEFAPGNHPSGWCISQPSKNAGLVLRPCSATLNKWQTFTGVNTTDTAGTPWKNLASGQFVIGAGTGKQLTAKNTISNGSYWGFDAPAVPPL